MHVWVDSTKHAGLTLILNKQHQEQIAFVADEIDAIGKARSTGATDSGTQEREQGLLQMLCELDGFKKNSKVCCPAMQLLVLLSIGCCQCTRCMCFVLTTT